MSGIPIYSQSPINATKASGRTPQTTAPEAEAIPLAPNSTPATTTASSTSSYSPARPGAAAAMPAATGSAQRYTPLQPTPTTKSDHDGPPAPQPGAVPTLPGKPNIGPPPKSGETYNPPQRAAAAVPPTSMPPQMQIPPPPTTFRGQPPASSTGTSTTASKSYPVPLPAGDTEFGAPRQSLEHPPGYHQNSYAADALRDQRRSQETNNMSGLGGYGGSAQAGGGDTEEDSVWNTAKKWAQTAGEKLSEAESEVWRRINK